MINNEILDFLDTAVKYRLDPEFRGSDKANEPYNFKVDSSPLSMFVTANELEGYELIILFLGLVPHISPGFFNQIIEKYLPQGGDFPEFGGVKGKNHRGIIPTGETALFILAGDDVDTRIQVSEVFSEEHLFAKKGVLYLESVPDGEPKMSGRIVLDEEYVELFTTGRISRPKLSSDFPAQLITTGLEWKDLVLNKRTFNEINEIQIWLDHNQTLLHDWNMQYKIKPGYKVLFHGPPGTGKTLTATLLGKYTGRDVYKIDLSLVVSKYIGETEKNLSKLFDKARNKDWILFFDEADSIFSKRVNVRDAHDKYANQEVSYLLQRIENHPGLVILASNLKGNIDVAFARRFNSFVEFENPEEKERIKLWQNYLPEKAKMDETFDLKKIASKYEITGANIVNAIQHACLKTMNEGLTTISLKNLSEGIKKEYRKEGKMINNN